MRDEDLARLGPAAQKQILRKLQEKNREEKTKKRSKYNNSSRTVNGIKFDSIKESERYIQLLHMQQYGHISDLRLQVDFTLQEAYTTPDGDRVRAIRYKADFTYYEHGRLIVEDVKSEITKNNRTYIIKKKMLQDKYGISIRET